MVMMVKEQMKKNNMAEHEVIVMVCIHTKDLINTSDRN